MNGDDKDINNESDKTEKFEPQDSQRKNIRHPQDDEEAVVDPQDLDYEKENADFEPPQKRKVESEEPINSVDEKTREDILKSKL